MSLWMFCPTKVQVMTHTVCVCVYIYIYVCVCVCVCEREFPVSKPKTGTVRKTSQEEGRQEVITSVVVWQ